MKKLRSVVDDIRRLEGLSPELVLGMPENDRDVVRGCRCSDIGDVSCVEMANGPLC